MDRSTITRGNHFTRSLCTCKGSCYTRKYLRFTYVIARCWRLPTIPIREGYPYITYGFRLLLHILSSLLSHSFLHISSLSLLSFPFHSGHLNSHHMPHILAIHSSFTTLLPRPSSCFHPSFIVTLHYSFPIHPSPLLIPQILPISHHSQKRPFLPEYPVDNTSWNWFGFNMAFAADSKKESTIFIKNLPLDITTSVFHMVGLNNGIATRKCARWIRSCSSCDYRQGLGHSVLMIVHRIRRECRAALVTWNCGGWSRQSFLV